MNNKDAENLGMKAMCDQTGELVKDFSAVVVRHYRTLSDAGLPASLVETLVIDWHREFWHSTFNR
ncbi:MAG: hypothetical protein ACR2M4_03140 [Actinomycetota bacterium]